MKRVRHLAEGAMIAALYVLFTLISSLFGLSSGPVQLRLSEALTVLPVFTPAAVPGLWIGCFLSNLIVGGTPMDMIFGSLATLIGAVGTRLLRKHPYLAPLPPLLSNLLFIPPILLYAYGVQELSVSYPFLLLSVGLGEAISAYGLGLLFYHAIRKYSSSIFYN